MFNHTFILEAAALVVLATAGIARGDSLPTPPTEVILTVTIAADEGAPHAFDADALSALGLESIETSTIWTDGVQTFEGVSLKTLMDTLDITDGTLRATAINDYTVEIPVSDAVDDGPILAMLLNGEEMSVRDKGPLWVVYPYDANNDYQTEVIYSRSIWQLDRIEVVE